MLITFQINREASLGLAHRKARRTRKGVEAYLTERMLYPRPSLRSLAANLFEDAGKMPALP
jgi:hypothetical protein